jgi:hypothetical protein
VVPLIDSTEQNLYLQLSLTSAKQCWLMGCGPAMGVHESFRSAYRRGMSTKHVRTTGDLSRFGCALKVDCCHCGSSRTLSASTAVKGLGMVPIRGTAKRFRCVRCGMKQARVSVLPPLSRRLDDSTGTHLQRRKLLKCFWLPDARRTSKQKLRLRETCMVPAAECVGRIRLRDDNSGA